ncbi:hypothetical protein MKX01_017124 [Papaver californicum]|nr:hypothetical protein MKX01_017124 [Papaver californicum]
MELFYHQLNKSSYGDSLKVLEADFVIWADRAAAISRAKDEAYLQMKLAYGHIAPLYLFLLQWMDYTCTCLLPRYLSLPYTHIQGLLLLIECVYPDGRMNVSFSGRTASVMEFYAVVLPSLEQLQGNLTELDASTIMEKGRSIDIREKLNVGFCMEPCAKMVFPNYCHSMCINCYQSSRDLWVLTANDDFVNSETVAKEKLSCFYYYVNNLPQDVTGGLYLKYYEYLI